MKKVRTSQFEHQCKWVWGMSNLFEMVELKGCDPSLQDIVDTFSRIYYYLELIVYILHWVDVQKLAVLVAGLVIK